MLELHSHTLTLYAVETIKIHKLEEAFDFISQERELDQTSEN